MNKKYDIIVAGGGFAGVGAAISAARSGKKVLLIEKYNSLGGAAVYDLVNPFMPYYLRDKNDRHKITKFLSDGIFREIVVKLKELSGFNSDQCFNEEYLKLLLNRMCLESGVELLFNAYITDVNMNDNRVESVTFSSISGKETVYADYFIDCTGDANLAYLAGYEYQLGRETDNLCQPMTLCFRLGNVGEEFWKEEVKKINPLYEKLKAEGKFRNPRENVLLFHTTVDSIVHFNTTRVVKLNPTDVWDVTKAEIEAREQIQELIDFLRSNFKSFENAVLISSGIQIGARESRMIKGLYTLDTDEMKDCRKFETGIAACNYDIDIHSPDGSGTSHYYFKDNEYYTIPYECLVPEKSKNMLIAGRCISGTHEAQASFRIMPVCCTLGEAAGTAAALACDGKKNVAEIDINKLRDILRKNGACVD